MKNNRWIDIAVEATYTAVPLRFKDWKQLWLVRPEKGVAPEDLLKNGLCCDFPPWERLIKRDLHMAIPRFDVSQTFELDDAVRAMGIREAFSDAAQTPFTKVDGRNLKLSRVRHSARLKIEEQGCEASA